MSQYDCARSLSEPSRNSYYYKIFIVQNVITLSSQCVNELIHLFITDCLRYFYQLYCFLLSSEICKEYREYQKYCIKHHITPLDQCVSCKLSPVPYYSITFTCLFIHTLQLFKHENSHLLKLPIKTIQRTEHY